MDNQFSTNAHNSAFTSLVLGFITWITPEDVDIIIKVIVGLGSISTAIMACLFYYYGIKEKKAALRKHASKTHK